MTVLDPAVVVPQVMTYYNGGNIGTNSYDLRVGRVFRVCSGIKMYANGQRELPPYEEVIPQEVDGRSMITFVPGELYQVETVEKVRLPENICAISLMRSSMHKSGASGEAGLYDSGYAGRCGMTVSVGKTSQVELGASIFQLVFFGAETRKLYDGRYLEEEWIDDLIVDRLV